MRFRKSQLPPPELDWTPMIDMSFQLIAFFMVLMNFSDTVVDQNIRLPISELARPSDEKPQRSLVLNMNRDGQIRHFGTLLEVEEIAPVLAAEQRMVNLRREALGTQEQTVVVIRSDAESQSGKVQELIQQCQQHGFERFVLRAQERGD